MQQPEPKFSLAAAAARAGTEPELVRAPSSPEFGELRVSPFGVALDYATPVLLLMLPLGVTWLMFQMQAPLWSITGLGVGSCAVLAAAGERLRPERPSHVPFDQPLSVDLLHFVVSYHVGYALGFAGSLGVGYLARQLGLPALWPTNWPLAAEIALAAFVSEGVSYWQHRWLHRVPWLWPFHALHHSGSRLNLLRAGRFHSVDIMSGAFFVFAPLCVLGVSQEVIVWLGSLTGALGVLEHANLRMRVPRALGYVVCTPAIHRYHHSLAADESNCNFGTTLMLFDLLFGSYRRGGPVGPELTGIEDDQLPSGRFFAQVIEPFRLAWRARARPPARGAS